MLTELFGFHDLAVSPCVERNHISKMHVYEDHAFVVLHAPERGSGGHVHYIELDQFIGRNYLFPPRSPGSSARTCPIRDSATSPGSWRPP